VQQMAKKNRAACAGGGDGQVLRVAQLTVFRSSRLSQRTRSGWASTT
jgi:hypothetical protein